MLLGESPDVEVEAPVELEARWVVDEPTYQVVFWTKRDDPEPPLVPLWEQEPRRLRGVSDVNEALVWAHHNANGREVCVYAEVDRGPDRGLVLLLGVDPTRGG